MTNKNISQLAGFILNEKRDLEGMKEGKSQIEHLFKQLEDLIVPGMSYGRIKEICHKALFPNKEIIIQIIPEFLPYHNSRDDYFINNGELITIDCALKLNKDWVDSASTFGIGTVNTQRKALLGYSRELFFLTKKMSLPLHPFQDTLRIIHEYLKNNSCFLVPGCGGHGIGRLLHQGDDYIYSDEKSDLIFPSDQSYTIEPVIGMNLGQEIIYSYFEETIIND